MFRTSTQLTTIRTITSTPTITTTKRLRSHSDLRPYVQSIDHFPRRQPSLRSDVTILVKVKTSVTATDATASRDEHYSEDQNDTPYINIDVNNNVENIPEQTGEQITPRPHDPEQEEVSTMLDEIVFHGADLAEGESELSLAVRRVTDAVIRREVRNAYYNLSHPSIATLLKIMRRSAASDAVKRYARW